MAAAGVPMVGGGPMVEVIYGKPMLPDVSRLLACLYEKEVEFKLVDMHEAQHMPQDFLRLQAAARLPVLCLQDGDTTLFESRAICRYLVDRYKDSGNKYLLGRDYLQRVSIEQWLKSEEHIFDPPSCRLIFHLAFPPAAGPPDPDRALITESERRLNEILDVYEQRLGERKYLAGNEFSLADLSHLSNSHFLARSKDWGYLFDKRKNVSRWWSKISNRPSWKEVVKLLDEYGILRGTRPPAAKSVVQSLSEPMSCSSGVQTIVRLDHIPGYTDTTSHPPPSVASPSASNAQPSSGTAPTVPATSPTPQPGTPIAQPDLQMKKDSRTDSTTSNIISPPKNDVNSTASAQLTIQPLGPDISSNFPSVIPNSQSSRGTTPTVPATSPTPQPGTPKAQPDPQMKKDSRTDSITSNIISPPKNDVNATASAQLTIQPLGHDINSNFPSVIPNSQSSMGTTPTVPATSPTPQPGTPKAKPDPQMKKDSRTDSTTRNILSPPKNDVNSTASSQLTIQPLGLDINSNFPSVIPNSQSSRSTTPTVPATSPTPQPGTPKAQPDPQMKKDSRTDSTTSNIISPPKNDVNSTTSAQLTIQPLGHDINSNFPSVIPNSQSSRGTTPTVPSTSPTPQPDTPKAQPDPQMKKDSRTDSTTSNNISPSETDVNSGKTTSPPAKTASNDQPDSSQSTRQLVAKPGTYRAQPDIETKDVSQIEQTDSAEQRTLKTSRKEPEPNVKPTTKPEPTSDSVQPSFQQTGPGTQPNPRPNLASPTAHPASSTGKPTQQPTIPTRQIIPEPDPYTPITPLQGLISRFKQIVNSRPSTQQEPSIPSQPTSASAQPTVQPDAEDTMSANPSTMSSTSRNPIVPATPLTPQQDSPRAQPDLQTKQATRNISPPKTDVNSKKTATPPAQTAPIAQQTPATLETDVNSMEKTTLPSQTASNDKTTSASYQLTIQPAAQDTRSNLPPIMPSSQSSSDTIPTNLTTQSGSQSASTTDQSTPPSTSTESTSRADSSGESTNKPSPPQST